MEPETQVRVDKRLLIFGENHYKWREGYWTRPPYPKSIEGKTRAIRACQVPVWMQRSSNRGLLDLPIGTGRTSCPKNLRSIRTWGLASTRLLVQISISRFPQSNSQRYSAPCNRSDVVHITVMVNPFALKCEHIRNLRSCR